MSLKHLEKGERKLYFDIECIANHSEFSSAIIALYQGKMMLKEGIVLSKSQVKKFLGFMVNAIATAQNRANLIILLGTLSYYFKQLTGDEYELVKLFIKNQFPEFWLNKFNQFSENEFKSLFTGRRRGVLWFNMALHYGDANLFLKWLSLEADFYDLSEGQQRQAYVLAYQSNNQQLIIELLTALKSKLNSEPASKLIGKNLSPFKSYLSFTHSGRIELEQSEKYYRSEKHWLNVHYTSTKKQYEKTIAKGGNAHVGNYINPMELLGDHALPQNNTHITSPGDGLLYDLTLQFQVETCRNIANMVGQTTYISVGVYNDFPCVMVFINNNTILRKKASLPAKEAWTNLIVSLFCGLLNAVALHNQLPIEMVRRSSFSSYSPSVTPTDQSFRISVGVIPTQYAQIIAMTLKTIDAVLAYLIANKDQYQLPNNVFCQTRNYQEYIGVSKYHDEIMRCANLIDLMWCKAEKGKNGNVTVYALMRTPYARQKIAAHIFNGMFNANVFTNPTNESIANVFVGALTGAVNQLHILGGTLSFLQEDERSIIYLKTFDSLPNALQFEDPNFWKLQLKILERLRTITNPLSLLETTINQLESGCNSKNLQQFYFHIETLQQCLLAQAIQLKSNVLENDGYGSDSDEEGHINHQPVFAKKIITHNGMRAILSTMLGIRYVFVSLRKNDRYDEKVYVDSAYYEVKDGLKLLPSLHGFSDTVGNIRQEDNPAFANVYVYDLNHCVTDSQPNDSVMTKLIQLQTRDLLRERVTQKAIILDSTSTTTNKARCYLDWILANLPQIEVVFFISSGLKSEQFGSDINHYGTIRIFARNRATVEEYYQSIKKDELKILSPVSHTHRRLMKRLGFTPKNTLFFKPVPTVKGPDEAVEKYTVGKTIR